MSMATQVTFSGTFTVEPGSGTVTISGAEYRNEYAITAEEPLTIEDLSLAIGERERKRLISVEVTADPEIEGFPGEHTMEEN